MVSSGRRSRRLKIELVLRARIAVLEVGAAGAADQQRVAGEHAVGHDEAVGIVGVAGRVGDIQADALDAKTVAVSDAHRHDIDAGLLAHHGDAVGAVAQRAKAGDVVGMQVGVDRLHQLQVELADELEVAIDLLQHGVDDQRLAAAAGGEQVGVGAGRRVEELTERSRSPPGRLQGRTDYPATSPTGQVFSSWPFVPNRTPAHSARRTSTRYQGPSEPA